MAGNAERSKSELMLATGIIVGILSRENDGLITVEPTVDDDGNYTTTIRAKVRRHRYKFTVISDDDPQESNKLPPDYWETAQ